MSIEAMKQALEVLELARHSQGMMLMSDPPQSAWKAYRVADKVNQAIADLRDAIEQASKQEQDDLTIAYMSGFYDGRKKREKNT